MGESGMRALRVLHGVWGLPQTLAGATMAAAMRGRPHQALGMVRVYRWKKDAGLSLGLFVFVPERASRRLLVHEYGHSVQSLLLGPLYVPLIVLPSLVWAGLPALERWRKAHGVSYYDLFVERWASDLGERVLHEPAMR